MPYDVTMCLGQNCPIKQDCYRFTAKIRGRQNFFGEAPYNFATNSCEHFISNRPDDDKICLRAYEIWQQTGYPDGKSVEHWLQAENELIELKNSLY
jgi:Protein of unknown function (DUF2934)